MAKLLFKLRDVPEDEAYEIRELLTENDIAFYETHAGNWGIGMAGIWIKDDNQHQQAMVLLNEYQDLRQKKMQNEYSELHHSGKAPTLLSNMRENPLRFIVYIFSIAVILYITVMPFINI